MSGPIPTLYRTELLSRRRLAENAFEITLARPAGFGFRAGQWITLQFGDTGRDYSLVTAPREPNLALCVRHVEGGTYSSELAVLEPGAPLSFTGPHGYLVFRKSPLKPVFVATGTGIAPFVSMARDGVNGFILLHGVSTGAELFYREELQAAAEAYIPCLSGGRESAVSGAYSGLVTTFLETGLPEGAYAFYLSGRGEMIRDVTRLVDDRFPGSRIHSETFY